MKSDYQLLSRVVAVKVFGRGDKVCVRNGEDAMGNSPRRVPPDSRARLGVSMPAATIH